MPTESFSVKRKLVDVLSLLLVIALLLPFPFIFVALLEAPLWWATPLQLNVWGLLAASLIGNALIWCTLVFAWLSFGSSDRREKYAGIPGLVLLLILDLAFISWVLFPSIRLGEAG